MSSFNWDQFQTEQPIQREQPNVQNNQSFPWDQFSKEPEHQQKETGFENITRNVSRTGSRIGETLLGIPGDISSLIQSGVLSGLEKIVGIPSSKEAHEKLKNQRSPTSGELKKFSQELSSGYTSAKNKGEELSDELTETLSSLLGPMKFRKALGVTLGSQSVKEGLNYLGASKGKQEAGKLGTMFVLSTINPGGALKFASSQFDKADSLSKGASIIAANLENNLNNLKNTLEKGVTTPAKSIVLRPTEEILDKIKNGKIPVQELTSAKRDINTLMGDPALLKREKILLKKLGREIDNAIKPYEKLNPAFSKAYRPANEIYGAVMQGNKASNFIKKTLGVKSILGATLAEAALGHPEAILPTVGLVTSAHVGARTIDFFTRLKNSPSLRKLYQKALISAAKEDTGALRKYADEIEQMMKKD